MEIDIHVLGLAFGCPAQMEKNNCFLKESRKKKDFMNLKKWFDKLTFKEKIEIIEQHNQCVNINRNEK